MTTGSNATPSNGSAATRTLSSSERVWLIILASLATLAVATAIAVAITYFLGIDGAIAAALTAGVIGAVILGILLFRWGTRASAPDRAGRQPEGESTKNSLSALGVVAALTLLLLLGLALLLYFLSRQDTIQTAEVVLTPVILVATVVLVLALGALTIVFKRLSLEDKKAAMGMPEGSIRAIIALLLIILFFVLSVYLFGQLRGAGSGQGTLSGLTLAQVNSIPQDQIISRIPNGGTAEEPLFDVIRRIPPDSGLHDIALQLLTTISTLVVAVAAFYFGSNSVTAAIAARRSGENEDERKPDEAKPNQGKTKPEGTKPDETKPSQGETAPDETEPDETKPDETKPSQGETEPDETKPDETKPSQGETEPDETKPSQGETEPDETKPDETKPEG